MKPTTIAKRRETRTERILALECRQVDWSDRMVRLEPRSASWEWLATKRETIYRRYAIVNAGLLREPRSSAGTIPGATVPTSETAEQQTA
jgi:hypothetical protein